MAFEIPVLIVGLKAASDMDAASCQFAFVKQASNGDVHLCTAATDIPIGVLQNLPKRAATAEVLMCGVTKLRVGATDITAPGLVGTDATSRAAAYVAGTATTSYLVGRTIKVDNADNDGRVVTAAINCLSVARGA